MAERPETSVMEPLGESEFGELDELLLSDDVPEACMDVVTLEGFLTAIAIGLSIPSQIGHPFQCKSATHSNPNRPLIPTQIGHP